MDSGLVQILDAGGTWTTLLFWLMVIWIFTVLVLVAWQRRRLGALVGVAVAAGRNDAGPQDTIDRMVAGLGPLGGGKVGVVVVALFWIVLLAALWSVRSVDFDVLRLYEPGYVESSAVGSSVRKVTAHISRVLVTRSSVGIAGVLAFSVSLLALDQMLFRPRTRLLDEVRRRWSAAASAPVPLELDTTLMRRARARWSWTGFCFQWLWLIIKGRPVLGLLLMGALIAVSAGLAVMAAVGLIPGLQVPEYQVGIPVTAWNFFWRPFLGLLIVSVPGLVISVLVAMRGCGWTAQRRGRDSVSPGAVG